MTQNISIPARMKRTAIKGKGEASASAPFTITKVEPQMNVVITRRSSALVRWLKLSLPVVDEAACGTHGGVGNSLPASASGGGGESSYLVFFPKKSPQGFTERTWNFWPYVERSAVTGR